MWPFKKKTEAKKRLFAGARIDRLTADWITSNTSADSELRTSLPKLRDRSHELCRDNDYVRSAMRTIKNNVVGQGIALQAMAKMKRGQKLDEKSNTKIESLWMKWGNKKNCHTAGKLCFQEVERLAISSIAESGEVLIRKIYKSFGDLKTPFALEVVESDLLDDNYNGVSEFGNQIRMGVEVDQWKRPVAYFFRTKHPGDYFADTNNERKNVLRIRIPANEIIHLFVTDRIGQTRGVPWLASSIMRMRQMGGYEEAEVVAARASASLMGFIETPEGEPSADGIMDGERVTDFEPGVIKTLDPGARMNVPNINRPGGQFDPFMRAMLRGAAAGIGCSYESISKDYSQSNYSSSRLALLDDRDHWRVLQSWIIANFHQTLFEEWLYLAVLSGDLQIDDFETNSENYLYPKWVPRGWSWIDPAKEVAAYRMAVRNGFMTVTDVIAQTGGDIEEVFAQRKREIAMAEASGIILDSDPAQTSDKGTINVDAQNPDAPSSDPNSAN